MFDQEALDNILNHPFLVPVFAVTGVLLFIFVILKFLVDSRTVKQVIDHESRGKSLSGKRKKSKKQKSPQEKKSTDSKKDPLKDDNIARLSETDAGSGQESKNDKRKDGRSKAKSKKKKNVIKPDVLPQLYDDEKDEISDGVWQTVSTKEQREQQKREKKKQEEEVAAAAIVSESVTVTKPEKNDPLAAMYRPPGNISAIAKGIAPRFARAAGEQWQEKPGPASNLLNQSKRTLSPNVGKQTSKILPANSTTVNQGWISTPQGKQIWPAELNRPGQPTWQTSTQSNNPRTINSDLIGMSWTATDSSSLLTMVASGMSGGGSSGALPGWGQRSSTWQIPGNGVTNPSWENDTEEWVHIQNTNQSGIRKSNGENWTNCDSSQLQRPLGKKKEEEWTLEPEAFSAHPPDPKDPWNIESIEPGDNDDWSAPVSTWDNTNDEWVAPEIVKPDPMYIDVSSDEDKDSKLSWSITSHQQQASKGLSLTTQIIVGAGPDLLTQGASLGGKKSRRRKKKKPSVTSEPEQMTSSIDLKSVTTDKEQPTPDSPLKSQAIVEKEMKTLMPDNTVSYPEAGKQDESLKEQNQDDWSVPKVAKKKKSKVRKAD